MSLVAVSVMQIGIVRMTVDQASMGMSVHVGLADRVTRMMTMLVVVIMNMGVLMFHNESGEGFTELLVDGVV